MQPKFSMAIFAESANLKHSSNCPLKQSESFWEPRAITLDLSRDAQKFHPVSDFESWRCHLTPNSIIMLKFVHGVVHD